MPGATQAEGERPWGVVSPGWGRFLPFLALLTVCACSEHLPAYDDPSDLFSGTLEVRYVMAEHNEVLVTLMVRNRYDETLQDTAEFAGTCELTLLRNPSLRKTIALSSALLQWGDYDSRTRILTVDPGESIILAAHWDFICDDSTDLRTSVFRYIEDPTCRFRHVAQQEELEVRVSLTIFKQMPAMELGPVVLSFCHIDTAVPLQLCAPLNGDNSCTVLR